MVLTPDQKRRLAELDTAEPAKEGTSGRTPSTLVNRLKSTWLSLRVTLARANLAKILFIIVAILVGGYFFLSYQLYRIDFGEVFSAGPGNPVDRLIEAVKLQKRKADMVDQGRGQLLVGEYDAALSTAVAVQQLDPDDPRAKNLIDDTAIAATQRASRKFDAGEIEAALADIRLALKHRPEHREAKELSLRIGERLLREAQIHYSKKEYSPLITKAQEVIRINPSDMRAANLLLRTNNDLLAQADDLFINKRYYDALEKVRLSLRIDPTNVRTHRLFNQIKLYIETPDLRLKGITKFGATPYAIVQLSETNETIYVKQGETVRNLKAVKIDSETKTVTFKQIYTGHVFSVELAKSE